MLLKNRKKYLWSAEADSGLPSGEVVRKAVRLLIIALVGVLSISIAHRELIANGFSKLPGDRYDMAIMSAILEHWKNFWIGKAEWHDVGYFYPYERTIAQTDGYFLIGMIFSFIRSFVNDIFISVAITSIVLSSIGFISLYVMARKVLLLRIETSLLISSVFVFLNSMIGHSQRLQLMTVYILPLLTLFLIFYIRAVNERSRNISTIFNGCAFGLLYGAMTVTCFYIAWFYAFFLMVVLGVFFLYRRSCLVAWLKSFVFLRYSSLMVLCVSFVSLVPFVWAYYPKSLEVGVRSFSSVSGNLLAPLELIQVGAGNYLYGGILTRLFDFVYPGYKPWGEYYNVGFSPLIFGLFVAAIFYFREKGESGKKNLFFVVGVAALICCLLLIKVHGSSLWRYVYILVPGAKALNVVSIFLMVLAFPVLAVVGKYIDSQNLHRTLLAVVAVFMVIGELTPSYISFDRKLENDRIANIPPPPATCRVFYVSGYDGQMNAPDGAEWVNSMYAHNVTAMLISQIINLPTVNGMASFNPPDWVFSAPWEESYDQRVLDYAKKHNVQGLCKLDLNKKFWIE